MRQKCIRTSLPRAFGVARARTLGIDVTRAQRSSARKATFDGRPHSFERRHKNRYVRIGLVRSVCPSRPSRWGHAAVNPSVNPAREYTSKKKHETRPTEPPTRPQSPHPHSLRSHPASTVGRRQTTKRRTASASHKCLTRPPHSLTPPLHRTRAETSAETSRKSEDISALSTQPLQSASARRHKHRADVQPVSGGGSHLRRAKRRDGESERARLRVPRRTTGSPSAQLTHTLTAHAHGTKDSRPAARQAKGKGGARGLSPPRRKHAGDEVDAIQEGEESDEREPQLERACLQPLRRDDVEA